MSSMERARPRIGDDEDLEAMQELFLTQGKAHATKVTRVKRPSAAAEPPQPPPEASATPLPDSAEDQSERTAKDAGGAGEAGDIPGILGHVQERAVSKPPEAPTIESAACGSGFPEATHRKISKFALGRRRGGSTKSSAASRAESQAVAENLGSSGEEAPDGSAQERAAIHEENQAKVQSMSRDEVEKAQADLEKSLPPELLEFLKRRGASHTTKAAPEQPPSGDAVKQEASRPKAAAPFRILQKDAEMDPLAAGDKKPELRRVSRARFSIEGKFVGMVPSSSDAGFPAQVVSRDPLRATGEEGYTLQEACLLARSSQPTQRAAACQLVAAVVSKIRPSWRDACCGSPSAESYIGGFRRGELWEDALASARVTTTLRVALDDPNLAVVSAAAVALAALLGPSADDGGAVQSLLPAGCPRVGLQYLHRPHPAVAWEGFPLQPSAEEDPLQQPPDEQEVAASDPLSGLLQMQLLPRLRYVLKELQPPAAIAPSLSILQHCALSSGAAARAVLLEPGLVPVLLEILRVYEPKGADDLLATAKFEARRGVLWLFTLLCGWDRSIATALLAQGLGRELKRFLLGGPLPEQPTKSASAVLQLEALETWRVCAGHGLYVLPMDDMYSVLCHAFVCPNWDSLASDLEGSRRRTLAELQYLQASSRAWGIATALFRRDDESFMSSGCAASLAKEALTWLSPRAMIGLAEVLKDEELVENDAGSNSTVPELAAAALAEALGFLGEVFQKADSAQQVLRAAAQQIIQQTTSPSIKPLLDCLQDWLHSGLDALGTGNSPLSVPEGRLAARCGIASAALQGLYRLQEIFVSSPGSGKHSDLTKTWRSTAVSLGQKLLRRTNSPTVLHPHDQAHHQLLLPAFSFFASLLTWLQSSDACANLGLEQQALVLPTVLPPGSESLALAALTFAFRRSAVEAAVVLAVEHVRQRTGRSIEGELLAVNEASSVLLEGYAAAALGLVPEAPSAGRQTALKVNPNAVWEGVGSFLPLRLEWLFCGPASRLPGNEAAEATPVLASIPEERDAVAPGNQQQARAEAVSSSLAFILGLELRAVDDSPLNLVPIGHRLRGVLDLLFHPQAVFEGQELWHHAGARACLEALVSIYAARWPPEGAADDSCITPEHASLWAANFATSSFGNELFGSCIALFLRSHVPSKIQIAVLDVLAEEAALHLVPEPPKGKLQEAREEVSEEVAAAYLDLLARGRLQKALESNSPLGLLALKSVRLHLLSSLESEPLDSQEKTCRQALRKAVASFSPVALAMLLSGSGTRLRSAALRACEGDSELLAAVSSACL